MTILGLSWLDLLLLASGLSRIVEIVSSERGPLDIFVRLRALTGIVHNEDGEVVGVPDKSLALLLSCRLCLSVALAIPLVFLVYWAKELALVLLLPFALSAWSIILGSIGE